MLLGVNFRYKYIDLAKIGDYFKDVNHSIVNKLLILVARQD